MILLPSDFKDFLRLFNEKNVEYLLVGGYAVGYYGHPRATGDMDVWVNPNLDNAVRVVAAPAPDFSDPNTCPLFGYN